MLAAFTAGLLLITVSELGDKTFFITAVLAMRYPQKIVFAGSVAALAAMTILSVLLGRLASFLPQVYVHYATVVLFLGFGVKLIYDATREWVAQKRLQRLSVTSEGSSSTAPCQNLDEPSCSDEAQEAVEIVNRATARRQHKNAIGIFLEAFTLTFLAEWGDRTQFSTITLAVAYNPVGVTLGAILGHSICAAIAVICGRLIGNRISETVMMALGGVLFVIFGVLTWLEGVA